MDSLAEWLKGQEHSDATLLAKRALHEIPDAFVEMVSAEIERIWRAEVYRVQTQSLIHATSGGVEHSRQPWAGTVPVAFTATQFHDEFLRETFKLNGRRVEFGKASLAQLEEHFSALMLERTSINREIERTRLAIAKLKETGASCLDEVGGHGHSHR